MRRTVCWGGRRVAFLSESRQSPEPMGTGSPLRHVASQVPQPLPARLRAMYQAMLETLGPQGWGPGRTRFEVIVGAILTQNTSWANVARAIESLRRACTLTPQALAAIPPVRLGRLI